MTTRRSRQRRSTTLAGAIVAAALLAGCGSGNTSGDARSADRPEAGSVGPTIGLAAEAPPSLAFVDQSVAPSTGTIAAGAGTVGVHSAPDVLYTRVGEVTAGDPVGLTGNRADVDGEEWAEIIWADSTAWIPTSALAS